METGSGAVVFSGSRKALTLAESVVSDEMAAVSISTDQTVVLRDVGWDTYEKLLGDLVDSSAPRLTFDRGTLEIMSPTFEHERLNRLLASFVEEAAAELGVDVENAGSTTFKRMDLERGFEPDSCFYVANADRVRGQRSIDLTKDPPPDLVIEIDITSASIRKLPIYAQIGVSEIWRYDGGKLFMLKLADGEYVGIEQSVSFPVLGVQDLSEFLDRSKVTSRLELIRAFREWLRE